MFRSDNLQDKHLNLLFEPSSSHLAMTFHKHTLLTYLLTGAPHSFFIFFIAPTIVRYHLLPSFEFSAFSLQSRLKHYCVLFINMLAILTNSAAELWTLSSFQPSDSPTGSQDLSSSAGIKDSIGFFNSHSLWSIVLLQHRL